MTGNEKKGGAVMEKAMTNTKQDIKLSIGGFIIAAGIFTLVFHVVLFPVIGIVVGIPWLVAAIVAAVATRWREASKACLPGFRWQRECR